MKKDDVESLAIAMILAFFLMTVGIIGSNILYKAYGLLTRVVQ